jgi:hypothetical protein
MILKYQPTARPPGKTRPRSPGLQVQCKAIVTRQAPTAELLCFIFVKIL